MANNLPRKPHVLFWECFCWLHCVVVVVSYANHEQLQTGLLADPLHPQFDTVGLFRSRLPLSVPTPLFAQTRGLTETILVRVNSFWRCVNICMNTMVCNPVGEASVLSGPCSANIGASIDIKQVSCSMACKVTVWRWRAVWQTISLGNHMFRYGSSFVGCTALWSLFLTLIRHNCKRVC